MTTTLQKWLISYNENHHHPVNKMIHYICVPLIFLSVLGMLSTINVPINSGVIPLFTIPLHFVLLAPALIFYLRHSFCIFCGVLALSLLCIILIQFAELQSSVAPEVLFAGVFALAWMGQFIGHKIERKKPSFLTDLIFLLIGPAWIVNSVFCKLEFEY